MTQVAEAFVRLRPDVTGFERETQAQVSHDVARVERSLRSANGEMGRFSRGALAGSGALGQLSRLAAFTSTSFLGGAGLVYGIKTASGAASSLNEQLSRSSIVFKGAQGDLVDFASTSASSFGVAEDRALAAASVFGTLFSNIGTGPQKAEELSEELVRLGADLASFADTPVEDALAAIRSGLTGEIEPLRRYGAFLSEAATQQEALSETGKKSVGQLTTQDRVLARYRLLMEQTTLAQGNFALTSEELANQQRTLSANFRDVEAAVGKGLNPALEELLPKINAFLGDAENQEAITRKVTSATETAVGVIEDLADAAQTLHDIGAPLVEVIGGLDVAIEALLLGMVIGKLTRFATGITAVGTAAGAAGAAGEVGLLTGRLAALSRIAIPAIAIPIVFELSQEGAKNEAITGEEGSVQRFFNDIPILGHIQRATGQLAVTVTEALGLDPYANGGGPDSQDRNRRISPAPLFDMINQGVLTSADLQQFKPLLDPGDFQALTHHLEAYEKAAQGFGIRPGGGSTGTPLSARLSEAAQRRVRLAQVSGSGTAAEVAALRDQAAADRRAIAFAEKQIAERKGNTKVFGQQLERLYADLHSTEGRVAAIAAEGEQRLADARQQAEEDRLAEIERRQKAREQARLRVVRLVRAVKDDLGVAGGPLDVSRGFVGTEKQVERFEEQVSALTGTPEALKLQLRIAESRATEETDILPVLNRTHDALARQLATLRRLGGTKLEILRATVELADVDRRIRDIRTGGPKNTGFSLAELFAQAGAELQFASNIGGAGSPLSGQDARLAFAGAALTREGDRHVTVIQNFNGVQPNPGQAITQASQAARALR